MSFGGRMCVGLSSRNVVEPMIVELEKGTELNGVEHTAGEVVLQGRRHLSTALALVTLAVALLFSVGVESAPAAHRVLQGSFANETGEGGGQVGFGTGVAINRDGAGGVEPGAVYVPNFQNARIEQFSANGTFVRAFGRDVVASGEHDAGVGFEICEADSTPEDVCKAGAKVADAGSVWNPEAIAVNQETGHVFVASNGSKRIDVFAADGQFEGGFGIDVVPGPPTGLEFCTLATGCKVGVTTAPAGTGPGGLSNLLKAALAVDPTTGNLLVGDRGNRRINEFEFTVNGSDEVTGASFVRAFGWDVVPGGTPALETCTTATGCQAGLAGGGAGQFPTNTPLALTVDADGFIYAVSAEGTCNATTNPCRIQKFNPDATFHSIFGPAAGGAESCQTGWTDGANNGQGPIGIAFDPESESIFVTRKTSTTGTAGSAAATFELCEFDTTGNLLDQSPAEPLATNNSGYLQPAPADGGRVYVNTPISGQLGAVHVIGPALSPPGAEMLAVEGVTSDAAVFKGQVEVPSPGGFGYATTYVFEYSRNGSNWSQVPLAPESVGDEAGSHPVEASVDDLIPNMGYVVRLKACAGQCTVSSPLSFTTATLPPTVVATYSEDATKSSVVLGAEINPHGLPTSYHFDWGTERGVYEHRVPAFDRELGDGITVVRAKEAISGLEENTTYYYRVVATSHCNPGDPSELCVTEGPERRFETLNSCGLTADRCFELVSPSDKGPVGGGGDTVALGAELRFQADPVGSSLAYVIGYGTPTSTSGSEVLYHGTRDEGGWTATQLSPPALAPPRERAGESFVAFTLGLSEDLACSVLASGQPLTADAPKETTEAGVGNLFRRNPDGTFTVLSPLPSANAASLAPGEGVLSQVYKLVGMSRDCGIVYFRTRLTYPGLDGVGEIRTYEWNHGHLRTVSGVPGPSGLELVNVTPGAADGLNWWRAVSEDGRRLYYSATRKLAEGPGGAGELNKPALFLRETTESGSTITDVSASQTSTPSTSATYQIASADGRKVFFTANHGLTGPAPAAWPTTCQSATGVGCDLYEYDLARPAGERLRNVSAVDNPVNPGGAGVVGVLDASKDGSKVYFAARGQLVPGEGNSEAKNLAEGTYSVYLASEGEISYVAKVRNSDVALLSRAGVLVSRSTLVTRAPWTSRSTPSGSHLLFSSTANITGYDSQGGIEAYLYDAETEQIDCVTCRRDGRPPVSTDGNPLTAGQSIENTLSPPITLTEDGERVFFIKRDPLAVGATAGQKNLYQWQDGQISFVAGSAPGFAVDLQFAGASASGDDLYFTTVDRLTWEDVDGRMDVYDARVGGGFEAPPAPTPSCDPLIEASCLSGPTQAPAPAVPGSASMPSSGSSAPPPPKRSNRKKVKKHKKSKKGKQRKKNKKGTRGRKSRGKTGSARSGNRPGWLQRGGNGDRGGRK